MDNLGGFSLGNVVIHFALTDLYFFAFVDGGQVSQHLEIIIDPS